MILSWQYNYGGERRHEIKKTIADNNYNAIDIGAYANFWSYPECKFYADTYELSIEDVTHFSIDIDNPTTWGSVIQYVEQNGKFDFSICSHTLEDIFNPFLLTDLLQKISYRGFIAVPSKYDEFSKLYNNPYRGNAHHKQFFDVVDETLTIFTKYSWIETDSRSDKLIEVDKGRELSLLWEEEVPIQLLNSGKPFRSDEELINNYYQTLLGE